MTCFHRCLLLHCLFDFNIVSRRFSCNFHYVCYRVEMGRKKERDEKEKIFPSNRPHGATTMGGISGIKKRQEQQ